MQLYRAHDGLLFLPQFSCSGSIQNRLQSPPGTFHSHDFRPKWFGVVDVVLSELHRPLYYRTSHLWDCVIICAQTCEIFPLSFTWSTAQSVFSFASPFFLKTVMAIAPVLVIWVFLKKYCTLCLTDRAKIESYWIFNDHYPYKGDQYYWLQFFFCFSCFWIWFLMLIKNHWSLSIRAKHFK